MSPAASARLRHGAGQPFAADIGAILHALEADFPDSGIGVANRILEIAAASGDAEDAAAGGFDTGAGLARAGVEYRGAGGFGIGDAFDELAGFHGAGIAG